MCIELCDDEPVQQQRRTKRRRTSTNTFVNEGLAELTDGDSSDYEDLDDFIVDDGSSIYSDEREQADELYRLNSDEWQASDWEAYLKPTKEWIELRLKLSKSS